MGKRLVSPAAVKMTIFFLLISVLATGVLSAILPGQTQDCEYSISIQVLANSKVVSSTLGLNGHLPRIKLTVGLSTKQFRLNLELNTGLLSSNYVEKSITRTGAIYHTVNQKASHCYYKGKVEGYPDSVVAISTCSGIVGYISIGNDAYEIEPVGYSLLGIHKFCKVRNDGSTSDSKCGVGDVPMDKLPSYLNLKRRKRSIQYPQDLDNKNKIIELYVANDNSQYVAKGSNTTAVFERAKNMINIASVTFQILGIYLVLIGQEVWTGANPITVNASSSSGTLSNFAAYRKTNINTVIYNDYAVLISNVTFSGGVVGMSYVGAICSYRLSCSFVADRYPNIYFSSSLVNHEIGHTLNLMHDDQYITNFGSCPCTEPTAAHCIMWNSASPTVPPSTWSQCSKDQLTSSFQHGYDVCLYDIPDTLFQPTQICGNGIVEDGEQCDCGNSTNVECNSACCNSATCQLIAPATCASGRCCNTCTCQLLSCGTSCRSAAGDCDLAEYCDGQNNICPNNTYKPDGTSCTVNGVGAYCYKGRCNSHQSQCELLWGPGTPMSDNSCYSNYNIKGVFYGSCGLTWLPSVTYKKCLSSDVMCGTLQCQNNSRSLYYYQTFYTGAQGSVGNNSCHSVVFDFGLEVQDPGLVPNGASCGTGKMCLNQTCVNATSVLTTSCVPSCGPNQVCNNLGQCQNLMSIAC